MAKAATKTSRKSTAKQSAKPKQAGTGTAAYRQHLELSVSGMTCNHCAEMVRRALAQCGGVRSAEVNLAKRRAVVTGDQLDLAQLVAAVEHSGYTAKLPAQ